MRQERENIFVENGAFYITTREMWLKSGLRYNGKIGIYEMPFSRSFQIDNIDLVRGIIKNDNLCWYWRNYLYKWAR